MDASIITAAIAAIKAAYELIRQARAANRDAAVDAKLVAINSVILDLQQALFLAQAENLELQKRVSQYEAEAIDRKDWADTMARYELRWVAPGVFMYLLKSGEEHGEPSHALCPNCAGMRKKSILQYSHSVTESGSEAINILKCPLCSQEFKIPQSHFPPF